MDCDGIHVTISFQKAQHFLKTELGGMQ